ncbi:MAG: hypothetical protein R3B84_07975 [Zavarzinella sp.]
MSSVQQSTIFQQLHWAIWRQSTKGLFRGQRTKVLTMLLSCLVIAGAAFVLGYFGFDFLSRLKFPVTPIVEIIFNILFFTLGGMLVFSAGLVMYAGLFHSPECRFLLTTPAREDQIFAFKFRSSIIFSSWAFIVLGGPILVSYGIVFQAMWYYYLMLPLFILGYVLLPAALGSILALVLINVLPQRKKQVLLLVIFATVAAGAYWVYQTISIAKDNLNNRDQLQSVFDMFTGPSGPFSPSQWIAHGLVEVAHGHWQNALLSLALLWSNGLMAYLVAAYLARKLYRRGYNRLATGGDQRRKYGSSWLDSLMNLLVCYLDPKIRLLIIKDFRTFRRDPSQVGQLVIFIGLLLLAVVNSRQFFQADIPILYQHFLSLINLCASGLLMSAFLGRFIYPLISLEGKRFWILGLLPLRRDQLLWGKFAFALTGSLLLSGTIMVLSDLLLGMSWLTLLVHICVIAFTAIGLSGICVGLSALLPSFRETDPSRIVLGFGGTINMLISLGYLIFIVAITCGPYHMSVTRESVTAGNNPLPWWAFAGMPVGLIATILATWIPMRAGIRNLRTIEF